MALISPKVPILFYLNYLFIFLVGCTVLYSLVLLSYIITGVSSPIIILAGGILFICLFLTRLVQVIVKWSLPKAIRENSVDVT